MKRLIPVVILISSMAVAYHILVVWKAVSLYQRDLTRERLLKAARLSSSNPDPYYRLGILYQWDIRNIDLDQSLDCLRKAIERNPFEQEYWLNAARTFQRMEKNGLFERAVENAIHVYPTRFQGRWVAGNLLLQEGNIEKAIPHFSYILAHYPEQSTSVYSVCTNVFKDTDFILEKVVPDDASSLKHYLSYLYGTRETVTAKRAWKKRAACDPKPTLEETLRHIDFLISQGELNDAFQIWKASIREKEISVAENGNLITNGGFEKEMILGDGFDWRIAKTVSGAVIGVDKTVAYEGKSSLRITFSGKENVNFSHVSQCVALQPDTDYLLTAQVKTEGLTTKSGIRIEISGIGSPFYGASEALTGENPWKELRVVFHTPARSQGGVVTVRREQTDKFDRFISGLVWIDKVRLTESNKQIGSLSQ